MTHDYPDFEEDQAADHVGGDGKKETKNDA
jgi:hypothetical protein